MIPEYFYQPGVIVGPTGKNVVPLYYVVSRERLRLAVGLDFRLFWWRPHGNGYTANLEEAGKFTGAEVEEIVRKSLPDMRPDAGDFGVPCDLAELVVGIVSNHAAARSE